MEKIINENKKYKILCHTLADMYFKHGFDNKKKYLEFFQMCQKLYERYMTSNVDAIVESDKISLTLTINK